MQNLHDSHGNRVNFGRTGTREMSFDQKTDVLNRFETALSQLPQNIRDAALARVNSTKNGEQAHGLVLAFPESAPKVGFNNQDFLVLPPGATTEDIKHYLEEQFGGGGGTGARNQTVRVARGGGGNQRGRART
jgi:hypothetical protein